MEDFVTYRGEILKDGRLCLDDVKNRNQIYGIYIISKLNI